MDDPMIKFDEALSLGFRGSLQRLDPNTEGSLLRRHRSRAMIHLDRLSKTANIRSTMPAVHLAYLDSDEVNAVALVDGVDAFIGITAGAIFGIHDLFCRWLSHPELMTDVGNPACEESGRSTLWASGATNGWRSLAAESDGMELADIEPRDPGRAQAARGLAMTAIDWLFFHELAHIRHGHCEYANARLGLRLLMEVRAHPSSSASESMTRRTLEWDADAFAAVESFMTRAVVESTATAIVAAIGGWVPSSRKELFRLHNTAMQGVFWLFGMAEDLHLPEEADHPPPLLRLISSWATVYELATKVGGPALQETYLEATQQSAREFVDLHALSGSGVDPRLTDWASRMSSGELTPDNDALLDARWKAIRQDLLVFSHVSDLAL
jgi:hypothetical protein